MTATAFPRRTVRELSRPRRSPLPAEAVETARRIVLDVRERGEAALADYARRFGETADGGALLLGRDTLDAALDNLPREDRARLERIAGRIEAFARAQLEALRPVRVAIPGGEAGHTVDPVERAGCYAPGGRHPLPSSVLMTALTARAAGVRDVVVASPRPTPVTRAAAALAGADLLLAAGGAHAIAALAYGAGAVPACDVVVGPGNSYVTAAKRLVSGDVGIDMLAGPSELVVVADDAADPGTVAADLLAQAEHDVEALPVLVATDAALVAAVEDELERQLAGLPTAETARAALARGGSCVCASLDEAARVAGALAPEHLQLSVRDAGALRERVAAYGGAFLGEASAEVLGDYGAGPNHVLPTGGTARFTAGLSVLTFLRARTWMRVEPGPGLDELADDAAWLARQEGLEAHARAAERRRTPRR